MSAMGFDCCQCCERSIPIDAVLCKACERARDAAYDYDPPAFDGGTETATQFAERVSAKIHANSEWEIAKARGEKPQ